ncbi:MAG: hypothetical protein ABI577_17240 [bacterium]
MRRLSDDPFGPGTKPLKGRESRALRVGGWRLIYAVDIESQFIMIQVIGPRGQAYRDR